MSNSKGNYQSTKCLIFGVLSIICLVHTSSIDQRGARFMIATNNVNIDDTTYDERPSIDDYLAKRKQFIDNEIEYGFGSDIQLNEKEQQANAIIMAAKEAEYANGILAPYTFNPSRHIFETLATVNQSKLFQIIKKMPKGAVLHAHDTALCSADYLVTLTYWPHLWQFSRPNGTHIQKFLFSLNQPNTGDDEEHVWRLVSDVRQEIGAAKFDKYVRTLFTLYDESVQDPKIQFSDINAVWKRFGGLFQNVNKLITYAPIWKAYYKNALQEMLDDGIQYLELRSVLPPLYDLNGTVYDQADNMRIYSEALAEFKQEHPDFIGSKIIYAPSKNNPPESTEVFDMVKSLKKKFPNFLGGFDLVGQEDVAPMLVTYAEQILKLPSDIPLFFHAGETNWFGSIDENLIDAVLLGTRRIGHGYGLAKHPKLIELIKERNVTIEINPVSNQVLKLVDDFRNHPASILMAQNVQVVISSDDPSFWEVSQLSHDFYMAFLGIASRHSDLRTLKKFAINSLAHSALNATEQSDAFVKWQIKWNHFIDDLISAQQ